MNYAIEKKLREGESIYAVMQEGTYRCGGKWKELRLFATIGGVHTQFEKGTVDIRIVKLQDLGAYKYPDKK